MVLDLNLLCSWAWNQIFIFVVETTGYLSVGLWFLQYLTCGKFFVAFFFLFLIKPHWLLSVDLDKEPVAVLAPAGVPVVDKEGGAGELHLPAPSFQLGKSIMSV